jgi:hypothetical protein
VTAPRIVLAACSRSFGEWSAARVILNRVHGQAPDAVLRHGDCEKGDRQIAGIWKSLGGIDDPWPADWSSCEWELSEEQETANRQAGIGPCRVRHRKVSPKHGTYCPTAGLRRDVLMVQSGVVQVLAFLDPESKTKGAFRTADMAEAAGILVVRYPQGAS